MAAANHAERRAYRDSRTAGKDASIVGPAATRLRARDPPLPGRGTVRGRATTAYSCCTDSAAAVLSMAHARAYGARKAGGSPRGRCHAHRHAGCQVKPQFAARDPVHDGQVGHIKRGVADLVPADVVVARDRQDGGPLPVGAPVPQLALEVKYEGVEADVVATGHDHMTADAIG